MYKISPSEVNHFRACPKRWRLEKEGWPGIPVPEVDLPREFGRQVHEAIKEYYREIGDKPSKGDIRMVAEVCLGRVNVPQMRQKLKRVVENFVEFEISRLKWPKYKPDFVEKHLETNEFSVVVDFYGNNTIIDWKTGEEEYVTENMMIQGKIYELVLKQLGYNVERVIFVMLDSGRVLTLPRVTKGWVMKEIKRMLELIRLGRFPVNKGPLCDYCNYRLECEFEGICIWML